MQTKYCISCNEIKNISEFSEIKIKNNFKTQNQTHRPYCRSCNTSKAREWRDKNKGYKPSGKITSYPLEDRRLVSAIRQRITDAKLRCKKLKKNPPDLTVDYLYNLFKKQEGKCALSGVDLSLEIDHPHGLSLDQIDPMKGYIEDNIQWLSWFVNRAKGEMLNNVFLSMCETILEYQKVQRLSNGSNTENLVE